MICNALSSEESQREDYKLKAVAHYHNQSRGTQENPTGTPAQPEDTMHTDKQNERGGGGEE